MGNTIKSITSKAESNFTKIIPEEIVVEILSRLPLGSLPRLTCVSKQWHSLISNIIVAKSGSPTVLLVSDSKAYSFPPHSIDQNYQHDVDVNEVHVPWNMSESGDHEFKILGSCNGLVLMHIDEDLFLWNPLTKFFKKVLAFDQVCGDGHYGICFGLCYDSTGDEYKALLVYADFTPGYCESFKVGSFRSKSWTQIPFPYNVHQCDSCSVMVNGNLHWFASKIDPVNTYFFSSLQIIYFDAQINKFEELPMPEPRGEDEDVIRGLGVLDGNICMSRWDCPGHGESNIEVLVMKEYGVAKSWTILLLVSNDLTSNHDLAPLGYTKNGEVLTRLSTWEYTNYERHIWAFNPTNNSRTRISVPGDPTFFIIAYEESLITPTDYGWEEEDRKRGCNICGILSYW